MKLQDLITSPEMTDGLANLSSVEKLVSFLKHEKSCATKNIVEATCRWSTIASILTATQNMDCLNQFIELGGLHFLDSWLQEAQMYGSINACDKTVEEVIITILEALIKLPMDHHSMKTSGIGTTVRHLHSHGNLKIRGKAENLSDGWEKITDKDTEFEKHSDGTCPNQMNNGCKAETLPKLEGGHLNYGRIVPPKDISAGYCTKEDACSWRPQSSSSVSSSTVLQFVARMDVKDNVSAEGNSGTTSSRNCGFAYSTGRKEVAGDESPTHSSERLVLTQHVSGKSHMGLESGKSFNQPSEELDAREGKSNQVNAGEDVLRSTVPVGFDDRQSKSESSSSNSKLTILPVSSSSDSCQKTSLEAESYSGNEKGSGMSKSICTGFKCNLAEIPAGRMSWGTTMHEFDHCDKVMERRPVKQIDSCVVTPDASVTLVEKHVNVGKPSQAVETYTSVMLHGNQGDLGKTSQAIKAFRSSDTGKMLVTIAEKSVKVDLPKTRLLQPKNAEHPTKDETEMGLTYEMDNALEEGRQVSREVAKEVDIYREASESSSSIGERNGQTVHLGTVYPAELKTNKCFVGIVDRNESCSEPDNQDSCCSTKEEMGSEISARNEQLCSEFNVLQEPTGINENDDRIHGQELSQLTTVQEDLAANDQTAHLCGFDLNEDIKAEEVEYPGHLATETISSHHVVNVSTPISVVAISRVPACLPTTPLQFEGELGWRGSAATSAFRPASVCKTPDKEKASSTNGNNCSSKHSSILQGIDLNVADSGNDLVVEFFPGKHVSVSSGLPSSESYVEVSSRGVERLNLDLNRLGDNDDDFPHQLSNQMEHKLHHPNNGACSPSPTSSSRPIRDFDLNDNPSFIEACADVHRPDQGTKPGRNGALDSSAVSIMGTTIQLHSTNLMSSSRADLDSVQGFDHGHGRKKFLHSAQQPFLMAGSNSISSIEQTGRVVVLQPTLSYAPPPAFSYNNGFGVGPTVPLPSTMYPSGVVPYMIDTRGSPIIPQTLGSSPLPTFPRTPYFTEIAGGSGPGDIAIIRPGFDLNMGATSMENESRGGNVRHLFVPASHSLMEDQMKSFQGVAYSGPSTKRKEPESGWESYQFGYKQATSWR